MSGICVGETNMANFAFRLQGLQVMKVVYIRVVGVVPCMIYLMLPVRLRRCGDLVLCYVIGSHCKSSIFSCPILDKARSTAASAFSKVLMPVSAGHHLVKAVELDA